MAHGPTYQTTANKMDALARYGHNVVPDIAHPQIHLEPWQYRITTTPHPDATRFGQLWLSHATDLPCIPMVDAQQRPVGCLLGFPIDLHRGTCVEGQWCVPADIDLSSDAGLLTCLSRLGGRFIWVCDTGRVRRIYPDAATQVSCVWDRDTGCAGATPLAILDDAAYARRFDHALFATLGKGPVGWFPAGLTAHAGVHRLLPNHYLDLDSWTAHRFDISTILPPRDTPEDTVSQIIETVCTQIEALMATQNPPYFALTGGYGTRMLLACARQWADNLTFVTIEPADQNRHDITLAQNIARDHGLRHRILPHQVADRAAQERYLRRAGHCTSDANLLAHPHLTNLPSGSVVVGGTGANLETAPFWYDDDGPDMTVDPALLLSRLGLPRNDKTLRHLGMWRAGLQRAPAEQILDLAYLENKIGPWAMAQFCANPGAIRHAPFLTYGTIASMMALPQDWRQTKALSRAIIGRLWPELLMHRFGAAEQLISRAQGAGQELLGLPPRATRQA